MIPLKDNIPPRRTPFVNYTIIALTSVVFVLQLLTGAGSELNLVEQFGMVPARVLNPEATVMTPDYALQNGRPVLVRRPLSDSPIHPWLTLLTCIFLHGGWMHFLGNMWFLHIFGDNVEDRFGHVGFLLFYLGCGIAASAAHLAVEAASPIPTIGASGAIAGVMGAYFLLYPHAKVLSILPLFIIIEIIVLPAPFFLGIWFLLQFFQGTLSITATAASGVAWWAHIGGFVAGFLAALLLKQLGGTEPPVEQVRPGTEHVRMYQQRPWNRR